MQSVSTVVPASPLMRRLRTSSNALKFGILYIRPRWFRMPHRISVNGKSISLRFLEEAGVDIDFICCFIRNDYGLGEGLSDIRTILDIGSNIGFFSIAARGHYPNATIHAYEPNPRIFPLLDFNTSQLSISTHTEAVGGHAGEVSIIDVGPSNLCRTSSANGSGNIPMIDLAAAVERVGGQVDLLKLDCEGAEWEMFEQSGCWQKIRNIRMEYHLIENRTFDQLQGALNGLGYTIVKADHDAGFGNVWATRV